MERLPFKDGFRDFQELVREHTLLRNHNKGFKSGDRQDKLLLFAEAGVVLMALERFLRILPGVEATDNDTLYSLLQKATSASRKVLALSASDTQDAIKRISNVRNTIFHGNYEQAAKQAGLKNKEEYFQTQFAAEIEALYELTNGLVAQINPENGHRYQQFQT